MASHHSLLLHRDESDRHSCLIATTTLIVLLLPLIASAETQRIVIDGKDPQAPAGQIKGLTEISVVPPFEPQTLTIEVDGHVLAKRSRPPYSVEVDLGPAAIEHQIGIVATAGTNRIEWNRTLNRGQRPLAVSIKHHAEAPEYYEAVASSPDDDPIVSVSFYDNGTLVSTLASPPYRVGVKPGYQPSLLYATAKTKSGAEATDYVSSGATAVGTYQVRSVPLYVSVTDERGLFASDLKSSSFKVLDNGQPAKIVEVGRAFDEPLSIALILDASGSMSPSMSRATKAAEEFTKHVLRQGDSASLFVISSVPKRVVQLTKNTADVMKGLEDIEAGGETALYDAIGSAIRELKGQTDRRAVVVLSDGGDNSSISDFDTLLQQAKMAMIPVYVIAYGSDLELDDFGQEIDRMTLLAGETGGMLVRAQEGNLSRRYDDIERDLREQYVIRYQVTDGGKPNQWRPVRVVINEPRLTARTIRGYFTP